MSSKTIIIGAGLAGLSAGYHAQKIGIDYVVCESENVVGGLCRTIREEGFLFDYSGHLLHLKDPYFQALVKDLLGDNFLVINRNAVIYSNGVFTRYPFQSNLHGLPNNIIKECLLEFIKSFYSNEDLPSCKYSNFREWILAKLGDGIGRHFMFPYNEKLWTVPTEEMTCEWLGEYVPKPSLEDVFNGAFGEQAEGVGYNANFWYPRKGGIQVLCEKLASNVDNIQLNKKIIEIDQKSKIVIFSSGQSSNYDRLVSTMPLKHLIKLFKAPVPSEVVAAADLLRHNSVLIVNLGVRGENLTDKHWIYLPEKKFTAYRVGVYSNFSPDMAPKGTTSYYVEIGYQKEWGIDKVEAVKNAVQEMTTLGLVPSLDDILVQVVTDVECAYVIYDKNYTECRKIIFDYLETCGVASIGRYGNWEYSGMEEAMKQGLEVMDQ
jgi:protoporphyrinogen oxidase